MSTKTQLGQQSTKRIRGQQDCRRPSETWKNQDKRRRYGYTPDEDSWNLASTLCNTRCRNIDAKNSAQRSRLFKRPQVMESADTMRGGKRTPLEVFLDATTQTKIEAGPDRMCTNHMEKKKPMMTTHKTCPRNGTLQPVPHPLQAGPHLPMDVRLSPA